MLVKFKAFWNWRYTCILFLILACLLGCWNCLRANKRSYDYTSTSQQIKSSQELTERAGTENKSAREAVSAAQSRNAEAAAINERVTKQLNDCSELINDIRADNKRAKQLLDEIIGDH